jgi:hypothetical protein
MFTLFRLVRLSTPKSNILTPTTSIGRIVPTALVNADVAANTKGLFTVNTKPFPPVGTEFNMSMIQ